MRKTTIRLMPAAMLAGLLTAGCASSTVAHVRQPPTPDFPNGELVVTELRSQPQREFYSHKSDEEHVWVPSYWFETHGHWVRIPGHWE